MRQWSMVRQWSRCLGFMRRRGDGRRSLPTLRLARKGKYEVGKERGRTSIPGSMGKKRCMSGWRIFELNECNVQKTVNAFRLPEKSRVQ
jgi:hypothetical protein